MVSCQKPKSTWPDKKKDKFLHPQPPFLPFRMLLFFLESAWAEHAASRTLPQGSQAPGVQVPSQWVSDRSWLSGN